MSSVLDLNYTPDGRVINETGHDPAMERVTGFVRYVIGADLGQSHDFSSAVVIKTGPESEASSLFLQFGALAGYNISATEVITASIPAECVASNYNYGQIAQMFDLPSLCGVTQCKSGTCQEQGGFCKCPYGWGGFDCKTELDCTVNGQCMHVHACSSCQSKYIAP